VLPTSKRVPSTGPVFRFGRDCIGVDAAIPTRELSRPRSGLRVPGNENFWSARLRRVGSKVSIEFQIHRPQALINKCLVFPCPISKIAWAARRPPRTRLGLRLLVLTMQITKGRSIGVMPHTAQEQPCESENACTEQSPKSDVGQSPPPKGGPSTRPLPVRRSNRCDRKDELTRHKRETPAVLRCCKRPR